MSKVKYFEFKDIKKYLPNDTIILGDTNNIKFCNVASIGNADEYSLDWINSTIKNKIELIEYSKAKTIICNKISGINHGILDQKCIIQVDDPKLVFANIVNQLLIANRNSCVHSTAEISDKAKIGKNVTIEPFCCIGNCEIGDNSYISSGCTIKDGVVIGKNVRIDSNTVIGSEGFGYVKDKDGNLVKFPHVSTVIIKDDVEIGAGTTIDRGSLKPTMIEEGVKIDNLVHIAHNVKIGRRSQVIANAMIAGSTVVGENCWIAPSSSILEHLHIGNNVTVGVGAVVTKNIPNNEIWTGSPARELKDFKKIQSKLKEVL